MKNIGELLQKRNLGTAEKKQGGINSARADAVRRLMEDVMRENPRDTKRFKYWLGRTRRIPTQEIHRLIGSAKEGRNPGALFNYLLKNYGKKETPKLP